MPVLRKELFKKNSQDSSQKAMPKFYQDILMLNLKAFLPAINKKCIGTLLNINKSNIL